MLKVLFFGDIMGRPGRGALASVIEELKTEHAPDLVVANVENLAHGKGVTRSTLQELKDLGVEVFTSGNHVFDKLEQAKECFLEFPSLIRPANYPGDLPGTGFYRTSVKGQWVCFINLGGQVFFDSLFNGKVANPFFKADELLDSVCEKNDIIIVDIHAEATSEKQALGFYLDGRVTALLGTHTHVPTSDERIFPKGTAYISDIGMTGAVNSVIGVKPEKSLAMFLGKDRFKLEVEENPPFVVNAVVLEIDGTKAVSIRRVSKIVK